MLSRISSFSGPLSILFKKSITDSYSFTTQNLILYLDAGQTASYPGTGTTWSDLSVQDNDATLSFVTYSSGYLTFNGSTSGGLLTSSKYNVSYSGKTIFVSAYLEAHMNNETYRSFLGSSAGSRNFNFYLYRDGSGNYQLHYSAGGVGGYSSTITITPGTWFTAALTHTTGGLGTYYFNGVAAGTENYTFNQYLAGSTENVGKSDNFWYGRLAVIAVYKTALSASEILGNHNSIRNRYEVVVDGLVLSLDAGNPSSYPGSGSIWTDLIDAKTFTLYNSPSYSSANGGYLSFSPASSQYAASSTSLSSLSTWSVEVWHYYDGTNTGTFPTIVTETYPGSGSINFNLGKIFGGSNQVESGFFNGSWRVTSAYTLTANNWYQIVGTYDGTTNKLYVNNTLVASSTFTGTPTSSQNGIRLMRRWDLEDYWGGRLSILRIYNRSLSSTEVVQNFNVNKTRFSL